MAAIVVGALLNNPIGYCVAAVLAVAFLAAWWLGKEEGEEEFEGSALFQDQGIPSPPPLESQCSSPEIFGTVEFAALRIGDLGNDLVKVSPDWATWSANLGVFIKATVNNCGAARTIPGFVIRLTAPTGETREARSERSIGKFTFHHYIEDRSGMYPTSRSVHDELPDLVEKLSTPLPAESHVDGWVHFEIKDAAQDFQELSACRMEVFAEDIRRKRYEIEAAGVKFANLNAHEWVTATRHG